MKINKVRAIITGGSSGLGKACVIELLSKGAVCAVFDKNVYMDDFVWDNNDNKLIFYKTDVSNYDNVVESVKNAVNFLGSINVLINCAGVGFPCKIIDKKVIKESDYMKTFNDTIKINLVGTMNVINIVSKVLLNNIENKEGERGVIINTSSIAAFEGQVGQAAYSASKAGIIGMMLPMAREFSNYGIRVVTIAPGLFNTPMFSKLSNKIKNSLVENLLFPKKLPNPIKYAKLAIHIIKNSIINGTTVRLDSGMRM